MKDEAQKKDNFLTKVLHFLALIVKLSNAILFLILLLAIVALIAITLADRYIANSFFTAQIVNTIIESPFPLESFTPAIWIANFNLDSLAACVVVAVVIILIKNSTIKVMFKKIERPSRKIIASSINLIINAVLMVVIVVFFFNVILVSHINNSFQKINKSQDSALFIDKVSALRNDLEHKNRESQKELNHIMKQVDKKELIIDDLSDQEYIDLASKVSLLADTKGGVSNEKEHYFRNNFSRAPSNLDTMIKVIRNPKHDLFKWKLVDPESAAFHMNGKDGEFNLKFISYNGLFEAVYNKDGILLTSKNDPDNMGTFNYANFTIFPEKHSMYDVLTYFVWNNTKDSKELEISEENNYAYNLQAQNRYQKYRALTSNYNKEDKNYE